MNLFRKTSVNGLKYFLFFVLIFTACRIVFLLNYGSVDVILEESSGLLKAFVVGLRFDISAICYGFLPLTLFWLLSIFIPERYELKFSSIYKGFSNFYLAFVLFVFLTLHIIGFFFYQFFQSQINLLFFGIFHDDTKAVLTSVWTDYPILFILMIYLVVFFAWYFWSKRVGVKIMQPVKKGSKTYGIVGFLIFPLFFVGLRGSIGVFPLRRDHTNVSKNEFVNSLCYNSIYSLKFANTERQENQINPDPEKELLDNGFLSIDDVYDDYLGKSDTLIFDHNLYSKTSHNEFLQMNPPNVVVLQMESMSSHYFDLHNEHLNLLGDLSLELSNLYHFKNCLSAFNGTIQTLEDLIIGTPKTIISQSVYFDTPFNSSVALPFKSQDYQTFFLTGANISWRNIDKMIEQQGFDVIRGKNYIQEKYPEAEEFAWGVHDGYLFNYIQSVLHESQHPKFIFGLTISNHTPYEIPRYYNKKEIVIHDQIKDQIRVDLKTAYANFYSHQYAASELGRFIREIRESPLGENTIIVATGDHNIRQVFEYSPEQSFLKRSVPILMYIPEKYKPTFFDEKVIAAHKDIFPTIFNLSLSDISYFYTGDNLFDPKMSNRFAINDYNYIADDQGAVSLENGHSYYYSWADLNNRMLKVDDNTKEHALFLKNKMNSYKTMKTYQIYKNILKHQASKR